ncbi:TadE/TadG family type IV pilus assembly protein [Streptomyces sp. NPDC089919]|uniref:TadE/TadG family type IV pilus assembly protein n=1 Tax=Streptomyces sp. NPDC089919 TaxID=3155188 RepID=UPI0034374302
MGTRRGPAAGARRGPDRRPRGDRGQTAVEFVGMFPIVLLLIMAVWECVVIGYGISLAGNAADEAARAGAVHDSDAGACAAAAGKHISGAWDMSVECGAVGDVYKATVDVKVPLFYPGLLNFDMHLRATGGAAVEKRED